MLAIAQKLGFKDLAGFRASLKTNPKLKAASADALLAAYRGYLTPMQAKLPSLFGRLPKAPFEVVAMPDYWPKPRRRPITTRDRRTGAARDGCGSTPTTPLTATSTRWRRSPTTKGFRAITCSSPLRTN